MTRRQVDHTISDVAEVSRIRGTLLPCVFAALLVIFPFGDVRADEPMSSIIALWKSQGNEIVSLHAAVTTFDARHSNGVDLDEIKLLGALPRQGSGDAAAKLEAMPHILGIPAKALVGWGRPLEIYQEGERLRNVFGVKNLTTSKIDMQIRVFDGEGDMHFNGYQANLDRGRSALRSFTWRDLKFVPPDQIFGHEWKVISREKGQTRAKSSYCDALIRDSDGFLYEYTVTNPEKNRVQRIYQYNPFTVGDVTLPRLRVDVKSSGGKVESLEVVNVRSAEVNIAIDETVFRNEIPAKVVVVDHRDPARERVWKTVTDQSDAFLFADSMIASESSRQSESANGGQKLPGSWIYITVGTSFAILLIVVGVRLRRV